jgi:hypothetical protein
VTAGGDASFPFTLTGGPSALNQAFSLSNNQQQDSGFVKPGAGYNAAEGAVPAGWWLKSAVCSDGSPANNIDVSAGEIVTCTFTNHKFATITVTKTTNPGGYPDQFTFTVANGPTVVAPFQLGNGGSNVLTVKDGTYNITEAMPSPWWIPTATPCNPVTVAPGGTATCNFVNARAGRLIVMKFTNPGTGGVAGPFQFTVAGPSFNAFALNDLGKKEMYVLPGQYTITEADPSGLGYYVPTGGINCNLNPISISFPNRQVTVAVGKDQEWICRYENKK